MLLYSTYVGGSLGDSGQGIAVDNVGSTYITGWTRSTDSPTASPYQPTLNGDADAFVAVLDPTASTFVYSTYLGGGGFDQGNGIAVDGNGNAYVTGETGSNNFPTANPLQPARHGPSSNAFVTALSRAGDILRYSTYLGGGAGVIGSGDDGRAITVDGSGTADVTGKTLATDFPPANPVQSTKHGMQNAFVARIAP
jgi:hypothetical protein